MATSNPVADWFNRSTIEGLLSEHASGRIDHGKKIWALYILFCVAGRHTRGYSAAQPAAALAAT
jgi:hypothetical protein